MKKELISLIRPEFQRRVSKTNEILMKVDSNILKYKSAIQRYELNKNKSEENNG